MREQLVEFLEKKFRDFTTNKRKCTDYNRLMFAKSLGLLNKAIE